MERIIGVANSLRLISLLAFVRSPAVLQSVKSRRIGAPSLWSIDGLAHLAALCATGVFVSLLGDPAAAQDASPSPTPENRQSANQQGAVNQPNPGSELQRVVVTGETAGQDGITPQINPELGVNSYTAGQSQIANTPGGASAPFQQVLLRLPGVVQDSYGEIHVRGEHGYAGYRINGVMLPEGLEGFGQEFDSHFIQSATLLTGTLPAQFGLRMDGVVDITTKTGADLKGGEAGVYSGSFDTVRPYIDFGGSTDKVDYFFSFSYLHSDLGIENPADGTRALHDYTSQYKGFGSITYKISDTSRLTLILSGSYSEFEIPDNPGATPAYKLAGVTPFPSSELNENQNEEDYFGVLAYQLALGDFSLQATLFAHYNRIRFTPDEEGDLIYLGAAGAVDNLLHSEGTQIDATYILNDQHTLRFGTLISFEGYHRGDSTSVFPATANGVQTSDVPFTINDADSQNGLLFSLYAQDDWQLTSKLTVNFGLRYDQSLGYTNAHQLSPRINAVYQLSDTTTFHLGYARYFTPPGLEFVSAGNVARFANTTDTPTDFKQDAPYPERANYFDAGVLQKVGSNLSLTADGFYKASRGGLDLGQFGTAVVLTPFNYSHGHWYGIETGAEYSQGPLRCALNFSWVRATAVGITSAQAEFAADEVAYIDTHHIILDHDQPFTVSANASYTFNSNHTQLFADFLFGSGLRYGFANYGYLKPHYPLNLGIEHTIPVNRNGVKAIRLRFECTNVFDQRKALREGSGVGIFEPQYLPPRGFFGTVAFEF
jgi:outer membrane receptor protein involved in Fe transport